MTVEVKKQGGLLPKLGLDVSQPAEYISSQNCSGCANVEVNRSVIRKRNGLSEFGSNDLGEAVMAGREFNVEATSNVVRIGISKFEEYNSVTGAWDDKRGGAHPLTGTVDDSVDTAIPC